MPRLFIGITVPATPALGEALASLRAAGPLRVEGVRGTVRLKPARPEALHLTLRFLGETPEGRVVEIGSATERAAARAGVGGFGLALAGLGTFSGGRRQPPRVVFAEVASLGPLQRLEAALSDELAALDPPFPREARPYRPHLTLARVVAAPRGVAGEGDLGALLEPWRAAAWGTARIEAIELIESRLSPRGASYTTRHRAALPASRPQG